MNKLELAVNHAMGDMRMQRLRMQAAGLMAGLDTKRPQAWAEFGWPETIGPSEFMSLYKRGGVAHGAVTKLVGACWKTDPWLIEGEPQDEARDETPWEVATIEALGEDFWYAFAQADLRRLVCRCSALVLRIADGAAWSAPVEGTRPQLVEAVPTWPQALKVKTFDVDLASPRYGQPSAWQYQETNSDGSQGRKVDVHHSRVITLGDWSADAIGFLEPAYNAFVTLEKVEGGSGESFLKNAARQLALNFDKEIDLGNVASMYGVQLEELQEKINETARELNRGNDTLMATQGATVTPMVTAVSDPGPTYNVNLQTAAAALDIPTKVLVGMQTGERASSEDQKYFNSRCQSRRLRELGRDIRAAVRHLQGIQVIPPAAKFTVMWDDLSDATLGDKLANGKVMSEMNGESASTGRPLFSDDEIRVASGFEPQKMVEVPGEGEGE